jgi:UDP-arabinose 4-epimerase
MGRQIYFQNREALCDWLLHSSAVFDCFRAQATPKDDSLRVHLREGAAKDEPDMGPILEINRIMARILITGGAGYVGSHCAKALAKAGHEGIVFDSLLFGHRDLVRWGELVKGDIRDATALEAVFAANRIDAVMHFAALAYVSESVTSPSRYYSVNVHGTQTLLDAMMNAGVRLIVFSSSCAIYGKLEHMPIDENAPLNPINPYGFTKLVCERMMDDFERGYGLKSVRLRYFNAAGADPTGEIGEHHEPETHLIPLILDTASRLRSEVQIFGTDYQTPDGSAIRDYVHVSDLARAHVLALQHLLDGGETIAACERAWRLRAGSDQIGLRSHGR